MAHQSLYRRYRPSKFSEVRGQGHVVDALRNAVAQGTEGHAYLFSGPRGTGKTSTARILAKALNCHNVDNGEPCGACPSCEDMDAGRSFDLFELDAASNNGVDAIRDLVERTAIGSPGRTKVYILDEVHMLSTGASNALLKTLEEPPSHVRFVLATTDPQKVLPTIKSRTQHFEFRLLSAEELEQQVRFIIGDAGLSVDEDSIGWVVNQGRGSARDTLSALDQVVAAGGVLQQEEPVDQLYEAWIGEDAGAAIVAINESLSQGHDPRVLAKVFLDSIRDTFLVSLGAQVPHLRDEDSEQHQQWAQALGTAKLTKAMESVGSAAVEMRQAVDPRVPLEVALLRLIANAEDGGASSGAESAGGTDIRVKRLIERIDALEAAVADGGVSSAGATKPHGRVAAQMGGSSAPSSAPPPTLPGRPKSTAGKTSDMPASEPEQPAVAPDPDTAASTVPAASAVAEQNVSAETPTPGPAPAKAAPPAPVAPVTPAPESEVAAPPATEPSGSKPTPAPELLGSEPTPAPEPAPDTEPVEELATPATASSDDEVALLNSQLRDNFVEAMARSSRAYFRDGAFVSSSAAIVVFSLATGVPESQAQRHLGVLSVLVSQALGRQVEVVLGSGDDRQPARVPRPDEGAISDSLAAEQNKPAEARSATSPVPQAGAPKTASPPPEAPQAKSSPPQSNAFAPNEPVATPPATRPLGVPPTPQPAPTQHVAAAPPKQSKRTIPTPPPASTRATSERNGQGSLEQPRNNSKSPEVVDQGADSDEDFDVDVSELEDATGVAESAIDLLMKAFPGATIEEKDEGI